MTQPPINDSFLEYSKSSVGLREIAFRQRAICLCILVYLVSYGIFLATQRSLPLPVMLVLALLAVATQITALVFVVMLTIKIYGTGIGILLGVLMLIPCVNLIVLIAVNAKATSLLKAAGLKVGLLGATVPENM